MSKFDGLIWKKGDDGWKDVPAGIGYVSKSFNPETDDAAMRVEDAVKAGYGGKKVDFRNINDLLIACPPEGTVSAGNPPKVIYAAVHPTNLKAAIIVWSAPVILLDASKIAGGDGVSLNGRVMTLNVSPVKIDGSDSQSINIAAGAVGAYGATIDADEAKVTDTTSGMYAGTKNDTSVGDDQTSQTVGQSIPVFVPNARETVTVSVSFTYKMEDAVQPCGEPHKIWGASYCVWGTTTPMETFPFGTTMDLNPGSLEPSSTYYGGTVSSEAYVDRGAQFQIAVAGVAGPVISLASANDRPLPLQPGQVVSFKSYLCNTVCGVPKMTKVETVDEALAYVDEDIIKPKERTFPVYTFLETTYYLTTMNAILTTEIPAITSTQLLTSIFSSIWRDTQIYGTAVQWTTDLRLPQGVVTTAFVATDFTPLPILDGLSIKMFPLLDPGGDSAFPVGNSIRTLVESGAEFSNKPFVVDPVNVVAHAFPPNGKAVNTAATGTNIKQANPGAYTGRFMPNPGAAVSGAIGTATLTLQGFDIDQIPTGGKVITSIGTTTLVVCGEGGSKVTLTLVTSIGTAAADPITINALTYAASIGVVTSVPTAPADEVVITTVSALPDVFVITTVPVLDPIVTTAITGATQPLNAVTGYVGTAVQPFYASQGLFATTSTDVQFPNMDQLALFAVTAGLAPPFIELTKFSDLVNITAFNNVGDPLKYMTPVADSTLTLPFIDPVNKIPILDTAGPVDKAVKLLISDTHGTMSLIGMTGRLIQRATTRAPLGICTPGSVSVSSSVGGYYENDGEVKLLAPMPVEKNIGNAETCPCFTANDPDGGPTPPTDNSAIGAYKPCTMRVRRLQLRECHV